MQLLQILEVSNRTKFQTNEMIILTKEQLMC